ncbi:MAG: hypothetical protein ACJ76Y_23850 [Thermoanaerobaculia bacterium]
MIDVVDAPAAGAFPATVEAWTALEHQHGVLPLVGAFFREGALPEVVSARVRGALGLFTPTPEPGWEAAAVAGEPDGDGGALLRGDVRLPSPLSDGAIVLVRLGAAERRLAWIDHDAPGVERRGARMGGPVGDGPFWLHLDGCPVSAGRLSRPVTLASGSELVRHLEAYAGAWAAAAAASIREGVRALRRAARTSAFNTSQWVALGITEVEIEGDLVAAAVRHGGGLALAAAAARTLSAVAAQTRELCDVHGLEVDGPLAGAAAQTLTAFLGGPLLLENELARALGIPEAGA